ncbi:MAG: ABC transporter permease, partial [Actinobacteria bacterium]
MSSEGTATGRAADRILTVNGWLVFVFLYAPIVILVVFSFSASSNVGLWGGFTLDWYGTMLQNDAMMNALSKSVIVALLSTAVSTVLGTAAAIALEQYRRWLSKGTFDGLMYLPV